MKSDGDMGVDMGSDKMVNDNCLKKGPWTAAEDAILIDYVKKHGEGNWNAVQKNSGLMRCGKSCRLRWANHLRPNLKKGSFSHEEEKIIIQLHAKLGNKWARMAAQLPGRTDNEIKNYWNTRMKRRQRAGLPIYPQELRDETGITAAAAAGFLRHEQEYQGRKRPPPSPLSPFPSSSACGSRTRQRNENDYVSSFSSLDSMNNFSAAGQNQPISSFYPNLTHGQYFKLYPPVSTSNNDTNGFGLHEICPISPLQQVPSSSSGNITAQLSTVPSMFQVNSGSFDNSSSFPPLPMGAQTDHQTANFVPGLKPELASFHPPVQTTTPAATSNSYTSSGGLVAPLGNTNSYNSNNDVNAVGSSGLLDALVAESQTLSRRKGVENFPQAVMVNGEGVMNAADNHDHLQEVAEGDDGTNCVVENHLDDFSSSHSSMGLKPSDEGMDEMTSMDDDLVSLLNNFPSSMPLPDWYSSGNYIGTSNVPSSGMTDGNMPDLDRPLGSCCWKNMHGIC